MVVAEPADRLDRYLAAREVLPSRAVVARLARDGRVMVNSRPARPSRALAVGDRVVVEVPAPVAGLPAAQAIELDVVFEDEHLMVVNKPAGLVVHPGAGRPDGTLVNALLARHRDWPSLGGPMRPGIVHRLDKGTSGLMLVARTDVALRRLSKDIAERRVGRVYLAVCKGTLAAGGRIEAPIGRDHRDRTRMAIVEGGRESSTTFQPLRQLTSATLLEVTLGSGRTHQVRVHLAAIGHPLVGDTTYGRSGGEPLIGRPALHSHRLRFQHPVTGVAMDLVAPPPADFERLVAALAP